MFDAHTTNRRERISFIQFGRTENELITWGSAAVFAALVISHLAGVL